MALVDIGIGPKNFPVITFPSMYRMEAAAASGDVVTADLIVPDSHAIQVMDSLGIGFKH
ncbi:MAG TPA: hypothetical protein VGO93_18410 [Candidatus Xenobia bacterium]|jgi:hypothetical protein